MTDATTLDRPLDDGDTTRTIRPRRSLPGGRAVVGAFLVVLATVGTFGAYLSATAAPDTTYLVATRGFEIGDVLGEADVTGGDAGFRTVAIDLPEEQAARAIATTAGGDARALLGTVVVAPISPGDLVQRSQVVDVAARGEGATMSLSVPVDRALAGRVGAGERVDLIATFTVEGGSETRLVASDVVVVAATGAGEGLNGGRVTLTVELPDLATAQQLQHAVDTAQVAVLRGGTGEAPAPTTGTASPTAPADEDAAAEPGSAASDGGGQEQPAEQPTAEQPSAEQPAAESAEQPAGAAATQEQG